MAGANLLTLLDDIATLLDDVAVLSKIAMKKTTGVLADDLALNAEQVSGVKAERELPVIWAVAKGSLPQQVIFSTWGPAHQLALSATHHRIARSLVVHSYVMRALKNCYINYLKIRSNVSNAWKH